MIHETSPCFCSMQLTALRHFGVEAKGPRKGATIVESVLRTNVNLESMEMWRPDGGGVQQAARGRSNFGES